jgi:hypothetical protein
VKEAPLRLPKCKHVFGDHCIKKWFEESDSCPYCRDKVPSEPRLHASSRAFINFMRMRDPHGVPAIDGEVYLRAMSRPDENRQWAGRRSPPSDSGENRARRIRARHGSRGSGSPPAVAGRPASFAGPTSSQQSSPSRDRIANAGFYPSWTNPQRRSITPATRSMNSTGPRIPVATQPHGRPGGNMSSFAVDNRLMWMEDLPPGHPAHPFPLSMHHGHAALAASEANFPNPLNNLSARAMADADSSNGSPMQGMSPSFVQPGPAQEPRGPEGFFPPHLYERLMREEQMDLERRDRARDRAAAQAAGRSQDR